MPTPPIAPSPPDPGGAAPPSRGAPDPPGTAFDRVLDQHDQAWTADAGGQQNGPASDSPSEGQQQPADPAAVLAALVTGPLPMAPAATQAASGPTGGDGSRTVPVVATVTPPVNVPVTVAGDGVPAPPAPVASTPPAAPAPAATAAPATADQPVGEGPVPVAEATAQDTGAGGDRPAGEGGGDAPKGDAHARRTVDGARAALAGLGAGRPADVAPAAAVAAPAPPAPTAAPVAAPAATPATAPTSPASVADAPPPVADAPAPTAPVGGPQATAAPRTVVAPNSVPVAHAPAALADLVHVAHERGSGHARLVLHPERLGGVEVHIRQTAEGIRATVHVEHADALQILQNGVGDLRRGLEARGVTIDSIDLGLAPGNQDAQQQGNGAARGDGGLGSRTGTGGLTGPTAPDDESLTTQNATIARPMAGVLVDVMA